METETLNTTTIISNKKFLVFSHLELLQILQAKAKRVVK